MEHSAPEVVQHPVHEKYQSPPPPRHGSIYPAVHKQDSFLASPEFEPVPPQYPGAPLAYPTPLVAPPIDDQRDDQGKLCGIRKGLLLVLLAVGGVVLLAIAVGVGVGVGLSGHNNSQANAGGGTAAASSSSSSSSSSTSPSRTVVPTTTGTKPAPSPSSTSAASACLEASNTQYSASNGKTFLKLCNIDYSGVNEATDIGSEKAGTFEMCIEQCAADDECTGAGWGPVSDGQKYRGTCWMKKDLKRSHVATEDWHFAVLLAGSEVNGTTQASASSTPKAT
ncbi:hypothetical protein B0T16DRAFT_451183 [Cercophora newfieldiana]|uniref:Apple domain-containing protein n=1 Tax=Cercophora newfieldiana TaxID=92897 RepID=A0AA40CYT8_9PEZI|nr:hypothetical protein B0T16DRAFT_451183 [Cercophora newfieldiana]